MERMQVLKIRKRKKLTVIILLAASLALGGCATLKDAFMATGTDEVSFYDSIAGAHAENDKAEYDDHFLRPGSRYALQFMNSAQKLWYEDIEHILGSMAEEGELSAEGLKEGLTDKDIEHIFYCVCMDHPELFYVTGYSFVTHMIGDKVVGYVFSGSYAYDRETALHKEKEIEWAAKDFLSGLPNGGKNAGDYEKIKYVYEKLILETEYSLDAPDNQSIYSALVGKLSVCQGYAKAMQYLLNELGVECTLVQGEVQGEPHGWNLVKADGEYYYVDVTWGDNSYHPNSGPTAAPEILDYLLVTSDEMCKERRIEEIVPLPNCTATSDNYFIRENAYFESLDEYRLEMLFMMATAENAWQVSLKCSDVGCFNEIKDFLLNKNKVFDYYLMGEKQISYYQNEELHCLTFWVTN